MNLNAYGSWTCSRCGTIVPHGHIHHCAAGEQNFTPGTGTLPVAPLTEADVRRIVRDEIKQAIKQAALRI